MTKRQEAEKIINKHILWALGGGLIPLPLLDVAAVTAIQTDMLGQLAELYGVDFSKSKGKTFVSALTGSVFARIGASVVKIIPGVGSVLGGLSMSALSGASTYAVGQVAINHFEDNDSLLNVDMKWAKEAYNEAFEKGKQVVSDLKSKEEEAKDVYQSLEKLGNLRDKGIITEEEFEEQKEKLLDRL